LQMETRTRFKQQLAPNAALVAGGIEGGGKS